MTKKPKRTKTIKIPNLIRLPVYLDPIKAAIAKASNSEVPINKQIEIAMYLRKTLERIKDGSLTKEGFRRFTLYFLAFADLTNRLALIDKTDELYNGGRQLEAAVPLVDSLGTRAYENGDKFEATSEELEHLEFVVDFSTDLLALATEYELHSVFIAANKFISKMEHKHNHFN